VIQRVSFTILQSNFKQFTSYSKTCKPPCHCGHD